MRNSGALQVVIALSLVVLALGPFLAGPFATALSGGAQGDATPGTDPNFLEPEAGSSTGADSEEIYPADHEVEFVANVSDDAVIDPGVERRYETVYTREGARQIEGQARLSEVRSLSNEPGIGAVRIQGLPPVDEGPVSPGVSKIGAEQLHESGVTGDGVTVGVIDSGFRLDHRGIAGHVSSYRSFGNDRGNVHGTAVTSVVADTAPGADIHLAAVGPTTSPAEYREAVNWLEASGADVIIDAGSYFSRPGDNDNGIEAVAANASEDVVFVTSSGNYGQRHWAGTPADDADRVAFAPEVRRNPLNDGDPLAGWVTVSMQWDGAGDYDLYLYRELPMGDVVVERSVTAQNGTDGGQERISATLPRGNYYVAVRANSSPERPPRLSLFASHKLAHETPSGSLTAPATGEGVIAVGAYSDGGLEPYSSRGPAADGEPGVDLVAPDGVAIREAEGASGTSFSAPYVAGAAALLISTNPSLSPKQVETRLENSASDVGRPGTDPATGYGLVNLTAAHDRTRVAGNPLADEYADWIAAHGEFHAATGLDGEWSARADEDGNIADSSGPESAMIPWGSITRDDRVV